MYMLDDGGGHRVLKSLTVKDISCHSWCAGD